MEKKEVLKKKYLFWIKEASPTLVRVAKLYYAVSIYVPVVHI